MVLEHLLQHAICRGFRVIQDCHSAFLGACHARSWLEEGVIKVAVTDEGPGIPPEWRERIFEPYARRDTNTARGSGIGLYAARRLAESMSARLWCEPAVPAGARFVVAMPAAAAV